MKTKIAKDFYWEMSHRLPYHKGLCRNIHGHSYKMRLEIEGEVNNDGMVLDYYEMSQIVKPVISELDHSFAVDGEDAVMIDFLKQNCMKYIVLPYFSTAENLAVYISEKLKSEFSKIENIESITVCLFETEGVFAEVSCELR